MKLPAPVNGDGLRKTTQMAFYGYDAFGTEGGIRDMKNMTSDYWPELAVRERRRTYRTVEEPGGIWAFQELMWADGTDFHYGDETVAGLITQTGEPHTFAALGDYIACLPEKTWYDTVSGETGSLEAEAAVDAFTACFRSVASPEGLSDTGNCLDLSESMSGGAGFDGDLRDLFKPGDAVEIAGCVRHEKNNATLVIREVGEKALYFLDDALALDEVPVYEFGGKGLAAGRYTVAYGDTYYGFTVSRTGGYPAGGWLELRESGTGLAVDVHYYNGTQDVTETIAASKGAAAGAVELKTLTRWVDYFERAAVTIRRTVPDMDGIFYHGNRLWGYQGDTIYASALGDCKNWNVFQGTASDSWTTETGTAGRFTGGISYNGYPRFFKENHIFTLFGDYPQEYQLKGMELMGVEKGSGKSLCIVAGRLYYLAPQGPCAFTGETPFLVGEDLGLTRYRNGTAGTDGKKYWISMQAEDDAWHLFVYDPRRRMWVREDDLQAMGFARWDGDLWCLAADGKMLLLGRPRAGDESMDEEPVEWLAEFGDITEGMPDKKRINKIRLRLELDEDAVAEVWIKYDSAGAWNKVSRLTAKRKQSMELPIIPRRVDHIRLKLQGWGGCRISSIARQAAAGSGR